MIRLRCSRMRDSYPRETGSAGARHEPNVSSWSLSASRAFRTPVPRSSISWRITGVTGSGTKGYSGGGGPAVEASLHNPFDIAVDRIGRPMFTDTFNHCIRRMDLQLGVIATIPVHENPAFSATAKLRRQPASISHTGWPSIVPATSTRLNRRVRRIDAIDSVVSTLADPAMG